MYARLDGLNWANDANGNQQAKHIALSGAAADLFDNWLREVSARDDHASSKVLNFVGKGKGTVLRLALVSEYLRWSHSGEMEPEFVSAESVAAAIEFFDDYALPMALRVYGDAALPEAERNAITLAKHIKANGIKRFNLREFHRSLKLPGMRKKSDFDAAVEALVDANWLQPDFGRDGGTVGQRRKDYIVHPAISGVGDG